MPPKHSCPGDADRPMRPAMLRGWRRRCPNCGSGPLLTGYLTVRDDCPVCNEELHHHRADDGPAYLTILIVGHVMAPLILWFFTTFRPDPLVMASVFSVGCVALSLYLLPRLKGMIVGIQWAKRMHGFGRAEQVARTPAG
ncbi:zinc-finger protein [Loktanella sp. 22II-4b]|nr:zinc-finger protein [Loktanella sp. 22II-4b]